MPFPHATTEQWLERCKGKRELRLLGYAVCTGGLLWLLDGPPWCAFVAATGFIALDEALGLVACRYLAERRGSHG